MSVEIKGMDKLLGELERRLGHNHMKRVNDEALKAGAKVFVAELKRQVATFSDKTGYSKGYELEEITITEPYWKDGVRTITVHWRGPHHRYSIIHLNEWGTVLNPNPRGKGKIAIALRNSEKAYHRAVADAVRRGLHVR